MRAAVFTAGICTILGGCVNSDLSKLVPGSLAQLQGALQTTADREATLITELQTENDELNFISRGSYACGDIADKVQNSYLNAKDPAQFVKQQKIDAAWQKSLTFIAAYLKALNDVVAANKNEQTEIQSLASIGADVAKNVPGFPAGTAAAATAFQKVASTVLLYYNAVQMQHAAQNIEPALEVALANVKKLYPVFTGNEQLAFAKWDSCAREKLRFIRDNPRGIVAGYPPLFALDTGSRLDDAWDAYVAKRGQLRGVPQIMALLKSVVDENKKLADPGKTLTLTDIATSSTNAAGFLNDLKAAVQAGQAIGAPAAKTKT